MRKLKITEMNRLTVEEFQKVKKIPLVMVLDDIRSLYNVGSIFRTGDAFRIEKILLCGITGCPPSTEIHKTALGAEESVNWEYLKNTCDAVNKLHEKGYTVLAIEQVEGSTLLNKWSPIYSYKYAFVMGNEVKGVKQEVINICDGCLEIPQYGTKHSLNVSCTASIVMWEYFHQYSAEKIKL